MHYAISIQYIQHMLIYKTCIYINIIKAHKTCYAHSPSITLKISSHGLIDKYEQFDLNYSTKHIISQKYFMNTIHMNGETLGLLFMTNHPTSVPLCDPKNQWPFQPHSHHNIIYSINYTTSSPNSPWTVTDCPNELHNFHASVPSFGTDQTVVQGLKPTESSTKHLNKV